MFCLFVSHVLLSDLLIQLQSARTVTSRDRMKGNSRCPGRCTKPSTCAAFAKDQVLPGKAATRDSWTFACHSETCLGKALYHLSLPILQEDGLLYRWSLHDPDLSQKDFGTVDATAAVTCRAESPFLNFNCDHTSVTRCSLMTSTADACD